MNISDAVQIVQSSPDSLQVYFPPRMLGGVLFLVLAGIAIILAIKFNDPTYRYASRTTFFLFCGLGLVSLFGGLDLCSYHANVTLSAKAQTFSYEEKTFYYKTAKTFPLSSLTEAVVRAGSTQNRQLTLFVASSPIIPLGDGYNSRANQFEAAHAINSFIARNVQR